jgi:mycothiol maleylpyruvate isomerase-like protein
MADHTQGEEPAPLHRLAGSMAAFSACVQALPGDMFLHRFTEWAPRDVVAHLIGWNRYTREAIEQIRHGEMPPYLADVPNHFVNVNAVLVQTYPATDATVLLDLLGQTGSDLLAALRRLGAEDWMRDFGARNPIERPVYIQRQVDGLSDDYENHAREIAQWRAQWQG